ncbi:MAG: RluA family pseudouridine synthase [candidate division KSB1 bacterium]|nr:RluA family pseudouridine synthase [candidate division KSB1 bacterium]
MRLDKYLANQVADLTRSRLQQLIAAGEITVNGRPVKASHPVAPGEVIQINIPPKAPAELVPQNIPLRIVYEDAHLIVIDKPAGLVVHPAYGHADGTLANAVLYHFQEVSKVGGSERPGIVHRLDKDTSGLLVVARDDRTHAALAAQFKEKTTQREYLAVVWGTPSPARGCIESYLTRSTKDRRKVTVSREHGKWAVTHYAVIERFPRHSLLRLRLETGRTHQIRVHLSHRGHPVFGDPTYHGRTSQLRGLKQAETRFLTELLAHFPRQALHAHTLGFVHPVTGERIFLQSELPADMQALLQALRTTTLR